MHFINKHIRVILILTLSTWVAVNGQNHIKTDSYITDLIGFEIGDIYNSNSNPQSRIMNVQGKSATALNYTTIKDTVVAEFDNLFSVMGTSIGKNSMHSLDIDNDGMNEIICAASTIDYALADFWYIIRYNSLDSTYHQIWTSQQYTNPITTIEIVDLNKDRNYKIFIGFVNGTIQVINALTKELEREVKSVNEKINSIIYADADNDLRMELIISCENSTYILNPNTFIVKFKINKGALNVRVGNVEKDTLNEIVLSSGMVYQLKDSVLTTIWNFTDEDWYMELSDIDNDKLQEIIHERKWYYINIYDVDTKTTKYSIRTTGDNEVLLLKDVNTDSIVEIIYGDVQSGDVICYNSITRVKLWTLKSISPGVSAIIYEDVDNDGKPELIWSAGWFTTLEDYMYIYSIPENKLRWISEDINGPFFAIASGDVDKDGNTEIVAVSYKSESGRGDGLILIIDALTNKIKWKSSNGFLNTGRNGIYNVSVNDFDKDGNYEIIIASGSLNHGKIWVIDGKNKIIKSSHTFSTEGAGIFYSIAIEDIDNDNVKEFIVGDYKTLYVITPSDWTIEWSIGINSDHSKPIIRYGDINGDGKKEILVCKHQFQIINPTDHSIWTSLESNYINLDIYDLDRDSIPEIITSTSDGKIIIINGRTKTKIKEINLEVNEISSVKVFNHNNSNLFIYTCDGRINFYINDSSHVVTQSFGKIIGEIEGLKIVSSSNITNLLIGTPISILKISGKVFSCPTFKIADQIFYGTCQQDDAKIYLNPTGGSGSYSFLWNDGSKADSLINLKAGNYTVKIKDSEVCTKFRKIVIRKDTLVMVQPEITNVYCYGMNSGSITLNLLVGNPPVKYNWIQGNYGDQATDLFPGKYQIKVTDAVGCESNIEVEITQPDKINYDIIFIPDTYTKPWWDGSVYVKNITGGRSPYQVYWLSTSETSDHMEVSNVGNYAFTITDRNGCKINGIAVVGATSIDLSNKNVDLFRLFPNPASIEVFIKTNLVEGTQLELEILNIYGQALEKKTIHAGTIERLDLNNFLPGLYIIKIDDNNSFNMKKILVKY